MKLKIILPLAFICLVLLALKPFGHQTSEIKNETSYAAALPTHPSKHLFAVKMSNGKIGFIDSTGAVILQPIYESAQEFHEGLCAVRKNGLYGFIDLRGEMVIKPIYDYATEFREGLAKVYLKDKPCFIHHNGELAVEPGYLWADHFVDGRCRVASNGHVGVIDKTGKLIVDTLYSYISNFKDGLTIASILRPADKMHEYEYAEQTIIDTRGNQLVKPGLYDNITGPFEGHFTANLTPDYDDILVDRHGRIARRFDKRDLVMSEARIENNIINISRYKKGTDVNKGTYDVYTTLEGTLIFGNKKIWGAQPFKEKFAFCRDESRDFIMINRKGREIARFDDLIGDGFSNGIAIVKKETWGIIDTTGNFISKTNFKELETIGMISNFFVFEEPGYSYNRRDPKYGLSTHNGEVIVPPTFEYFDHRGFIAGLLKTWVGNRTTYFNKGGDVVWQEDTLKKEKRPLNIDYMQRCYFSVRHNGTGHPSPDGRAAKTITSALPFYFPEELRVVVDPNHSGDADAPYKTMTAYIANCTQDTIVFNAQDGRLYMITQALNESGQWDDIDFMPHSWCGNSYHSVALLRNQYWQLSMPIYEGVFKTRLRLKLTYIDPRDNTTDSRRSYSRADGYPRRSAKSLTIYSNEFEASINPAQLWRKEIHYAQGIMDPYDE